ncbi:hypothetical protein AB0M32_36155 [Streptomyces sp. NPDC051985]|uniref:hypothetical protein n=1 Tax=Streptomyces sp. NPDC051985 TaxID=3155807 RepID=UPI0034231148
MIYQGADYGTWNTATHKFTICDLENDGHPAYIYFKKLNGTESSHVFDADSYGGGCSGGTLGAASSSNPWNTVWVCEQIDFVTDPCGVDGVTYE